MTNLTIGFSKPKNKKIPIFSWIIRLVQKTEYSHVYIQWDSEGIQEKIRYQASGLSVNFIGHKMFESQIQVVSEYKLNGDITRECRRKLMKFCIANSGVPYGMKQIAGMALMTIFNLKKNPFNDQEATYVCSELIAVILRDSFDMKSDIDLDTIGPKDIENLVKNNPKFSKVL